MGITTFIFFLFAGIGLLIYWRLPQKYQWVLLLADSLIFYCCNAQPWTLIYVLFSVCSVHIATVRFARIDETDGANSMAAMDHKKKVLLPTIILNIGILAILKYSNLMIHTFNFALGGVPAI